MPFGLKNAGATYHRTMQRCLHDQIGQKVHAYVDDIAYCGDEPLQHEPPLATHRCIAECLYKRC
jgi:hypothetical protein